MSVKSKGFKPNLASPVDMAILRYPVLASVKLDGIRATVHDGVLMSRSMKPIPSRFLQAWCGGNQEFLNGLDGELIVGEPNLPDTFRTTTSHVMADDKVDFPFTFWVFDRHDMPGVPYLERRLAIASAASQLPGCVRESQLPGCVRVLQDALIDDQDALDAFEELALKLGHEGVMVRDPNGLYKQGRSSAREQGLLKVKRYEDMEAVVIGWEERQHNGNEAFRNELGRTARSSAQAGKTGMGTLGALTVRGLNGVFKDVEFSVGTGMDDVERAALWAGRDTLAGRISKVKFFNVGSKDKPRHPVHLGFRDADDMDAAV